MEAMMKAQRTTGVRYYEIPSKRNSESPFPTQEEVIDSILKRHIRILKYSNHVANAVNVEFYGFRNELVSDLLLDVRDSMFEDSVSRVDKFIEKMHVKFYQLRKRIEYVLDSNISGLIHNEISFLEGVFPSLNFDKSKYPVHELFGVSYIDHFNSIFLSLRKDVISNYKVSISLNHPDSFLLEKFRGTREFNYKNSIFSQYHNKLKSLVKSIICSYSSELRFFFYFKHQNKFPFFAESLPISESKSKKSKTKLGTYKTEDFSPQKGSESWKGCLPHFNSTVTQIPLYSLDESDKHDLRDWFFNRSETYQKEIVGENRFRIMESGDYVHSQIFDFSKTSITIANL